MIYSFPVVATRLVSDRRRIDFPAIELETGTLGVNQVRRENLIRLQNPGKANPVMTSVILKAHFDGKQIVLDEPFELSANAELAVMVLAPATPEHDADRAEWADLSTQSLARAYGDDEPEYTLADLKS